MKILHIMDTDRSLPHATDIVSGLQTLGFTQSIFLSHSFSGWKGMQKFRLRLKTWKIKPDIIHCWTADSARLLGRKKGKEQAIVAGWFGISADRDKFQACGHLVSASQRAARRTQKATQHKKIYFIPKAPLITAQAPIDRAGLATARESKVMLVFVRSLPGKDIEILLGFLKESPQWVGWFVGTGVWRHELENLARKHNLMDRMRFLKRRTDRGALLRAADICVIPPQSDPFGTIMCEAWGAGTPVVVCSEPACPIEDGVTALVVPGGDGAALAKALARVTEDEILRRSMIAQAYAAYIKSYTRDSVLRQWAEFFKSLKPA